MPQPPNRLTLGNLGLYLTPLQLGPMPAAAIDFLQVLLLKNLSKISKKVKGVNAREIKS